MCKLIRPLDILIKDITITAEESCNKKYYTDIIYHKYRKYTKI